jgi:hypothetical protein
MNQIANIRYNMDHVIFVPNMHPNYSAQRDRKLERMLSHMTYDEFKHPRFIGWGRWAQFSRHYLDQFNYNMVFAKSKIFKKTSKDVKGLIKAKFK